MPGPSWRLALAALALTPLPLLAAGSATIKSGAEISEISWLDTQTVRMDLAAEGGYMVLREGKIYMVYTDPEGGMPPVMEVGDMMQGLVEALANDDDMNDSASPLSQRTASVEKTGKTETVAGIKGDVYDVAFVDGKGETSHQTVVLTSDALVTEMTTAYFAVSGAMMGSERVAEFTDALPRKQRGLLRMGDDMVLQAISKEAPTANAFELPAEPVNFGDMMKGLMEQSQQ